jgi:pimeloyl-ACP methyl ester carboxylesterase
VDVVVHSYRHRLGNAPGEPRFAQVEQQLARRPKIIVPATVLYGADDALRIGPIGDGDTSVFASLVARRVVPGAGHFMPRERSDAVSASMLELLTSAH